MQEVENPMQVFDQTTFIYTYIHNFLTSRLIVLDSGK